MKNCLAIEGIGSSNNNSLPVFNQLKLHAVKVASVTQDAQVAFRFGTNDKITVSVPEGHYFATSFANLSDPSKRLTSKEIIASDGEVHLYFENEDYDIFVDGKYSLTILKNSIGTSNVKCLITLDLSDVEYLTSLQKLRMAYSDVTGDTSYLKKLTLATEITLQGSTKFTGKLEDFYGLTNLTEFGIVNTTISGSIEEFVEGQYANQRTSCESMKSNGILKQLTFGGVKLSELTSAMWLTWSSTSKIAVHVGSTLAGATTIYAKGATAEEIAAWKTAGKTVWAYENNEWVQK